MRRSLTRIASFVLSLFSSLDVSFAGETQSPPVPDAVVDLRTRDGARLVQGQWRFAPVRVAGNDIAPHAGAEAFDDSAWEAIPAESLEARRGDGKLSFAWYRISVTIPDRLGDVATHGAAVWFEIVVDDYAEVWVNGKLPVALGKRGGSLVSGFNATNRVLLTDHATPGDQFELAVFAINAPLSQPPGNFIWIRSATLDVYAAGRDQVGTPVQTTIVRDDPALDHIVEPDARLEQLATGFGFCEGPVWMNDEHGGALLFSDPNRNVIHRWSPNDGASIYRTKSGYAGLDIGAYRQPGSNGLALDNEGRLTICEHGNRRISRLEKNGALTVLADHYEGKRLNSPNDLVYTSHGDLYFTDPPFGLPKVYDDPAKELPYCGVFLLRDGTLTLVSTDLKGPNGIALSPDEEHLYVANWDEQKKVVMRYDILPDGSLTNGVIFFDMTSAPGEEALDGIKVDARGNLFVSGPGGLWIISPEGKRLGMIVGPELPANMAWGDDGQTLYLAARTSLYRIRLKTGA